MLSHPEIARHVGGKFFRVVFVKRTDGSIREMRARLGVRKHLAGGEARYSFSAKNLLSVWDLDKRGYRTIPLDAIMDFQCGAVRLLEDGTLGLRTEEIHERDFEKIPPQPQSIDFPAY